MVLVEEKLKVEIKYKTRNVLRKIYINTIMPYFNYKNKTGKNVYTRKCCAKL
jgi:hypothetical protein